MGNSQAAGYADAIDQGLCSLKQALAAHLTSNHYPPLPTELVPACVKAIRNCNEGRSDKRVTLPRGMQLAVSRVGEHYTTTPPSWRLAEACHLDCFIQYEED